MKILLVNNHTKDIEELKRLLDGFDFSVILHEDFSAGSADGFDLVILSGGSGIRSVKNHPADYQTEIDFIKNTDKKIIGICLGAQIIATAFGCTLTGLDAEHKGITTMRFEGREVLVYEAHRFAINQVSDFIEVLATSDHGIEMIKHKTKPIYGLQFHPEMFIDKTGGGEVFYKILNKLGVID
jgi:GMP synthase (glutamine-hydrolysing)